MQDAVVAAFGRTSLHAGDLAWMRRFHTHRELALDIRLWTDAGDGLAAWTFYRSNGEFTWFIAPGRADAALAEAMLDTIEAAAAETERAGDPPVEIETYGIVEERSPEDAAMAAAMRARGFEGPGEGGLLERPAAGAPAPSPPPGYRLAAVDDELVVGRVEAHRGAFAPSVLSVEQYRRVRRTWPYRADLDRVAVHEDGTVAAFCTGWLDEANAAGLLEPVGTHPGHRRRGLATAVCLDAVRALEAAGARTVAVGFETAAAEALYRSIGCTLRWADGAFTRRAR